MRPTTLIGRSAERHALHTALGERTTRPSWTILIAGEAGTGKTALVDDTVLSDTTRRAVVARATEDATPPYATLTTILRAAIRELDPGPSKIGPLAPYLGLLLPEIGPPPGETDRETLVEAVGAAFVTVARAHPLTVVIEDLQWADDASLEMLPSLTDRWREHPVVLVGTYRSDEVPRDHPLRRLRNELRRTRCVTEVTVGPLDVADTGYLLENCLGARAGESLVERVHRETQGVPLFIEEMAAALLASGSVRTGDDGFELLSGHGVPIPESIRDAVTVRLDSLSAAAREQLEAAAVVGTEFDLALVTDLAGDEAATEELLERSIIEETRPGRARFRHTLLREAAKGEITWSRRRTLHRKIATYLETRGGAPEAVAEHWLAAHEHDRARTALVAAAERSCRVHAYRNAASSATRALELWPDGEEVESRLAMVERLANCAEVAGMLGEATRAWRELAEAASLRQDPARRGRARRSLATVLTLQGTWDHAMTARRAAADDFREAGEVGEAAVEILSIAGHHTAALDLAASRETVAEAIAAADEASRWDVKARGLGLQGTVQAMEGNFTQARETVESGLSLALEHGLTDVASEVYRRLGSVHEFAADYPRARKAYLDALDYCHTNGTEAAATTCMGCMSYVFFFSGHWKQALEVCDELLSSATATGGSQSAGYTTLALITILKGDVTTGRKHLEAMMAIARREEIVILVIIAHWGEALLAELEDDPVRATRAYRAAIDAWAPTQERHDVVPILAMAASHFAAQELEEELAGAVRALTHVAGATGNPMALGALAHALAESAAAGRDHAEGRKQVERALSHLEPLEVPILQTVVELRGARTLALGGNGDRALELLGRAARQCRALGARALGARVSAMRTELREQGLIPEAADPADLTTLTPRQREVARLIAEGLTNKEIAARLHLSPRTVDMHVSAVLDRLDARTRTEAAQRAQDLGLLGP